jgi:hypothetical protein
MPGIISRSAYLSCRRDGARSRPLKGNRQRLQHRRQAKGDEWRLRRHEFPRSASGGTALFCLIRSRLPRGLTDTFDDGAIGDPHPFSDPQVGRSILHQRLYGTVIHAHCHTISLVAGARILFHLVAHYRAACSACDGGRSPAASAPDLIPEDAAYYRTAQRSDAYSAGCVALHQVNRLDDAKSGCTAGAAG